MKLLKLSFSIYTLCIIALLFSQSALADGHIAAGKTKSATCVACHGPGGNSVNPIWPKLSSLDATYIKKQLQYFKEGKRINALMAPQVMSLTKKDMANIGAYYESIKRSPGAAHKDLVERGKNLYAGGNAETGVAACIACHGPKGNGNPAAGYPKISFQHAAYMADRLKRYRAAGADSDYPGSEIMVGIAKNLTDKEIAAVTSYVQGLH